MTDFRRMVRWGCVALLATLLSGCRSTRAPVHVVFPFDEGFSVGNYENLAVTVSVDEGQHLYETGLQRLRSRIAETIRRDAPHLRLCDPDDLPPGRALRLDVHITRYDQGDRIKRSMLMGMGRVVIEGMVRATDARQGTMLGEYLVRKQFAWGGMYGGMTTVQDVEVGFAEGVSNGVTGRGRLVDFEAEGHTRDG